MANVVNLNKHRKAKAAARAKTQAMQNRIRCGRTKVEKAFDAVRSKARVRLDARAPLEPEQD